MEDSLYNHGFGVINSSDEINLLDYCYYLILIPNGVQVTINGVTTGPFDYPIIIPLTTSPYNVIPTGGLVYFIGEKNFINPDAPITGDNYIISDDIQGNEIVISDSGDDIIWS